MLNLHHLHEKENTPGLMKNLGSAAKQHHHALTAKQPIKSSATSNNIFASARKGPLVNQRVAALLDITNSTPAPKLKPTANKPTTKQLQNANVTPKPGTGRGTRQKNTGTAPVKISVHVDSDVTANSQQVVGGQVKEQEEVKKMDDGIPDIEYAPMDTVVPLEFMMEPIDIKGLSTPQWSEVFVSKSLDEISDYTMEPELSRYENLEFDAFDIVLDPNHDPLASLDPVESFMF
ncbi:UNVERIFIED_CONTAM: hypothetical protein HDU68_008690 [Siphonaria sp. JEL0065]|nr:hypothetical protein HDU68_008690 [Siphonaria sp. JEL0065]